MKRHLVFNIANVDTIYDLSINLDIKSFFDNNDRKELISIQFLFFCILFAYN